MKIKIFQDFEDIKEEWLHLETCSDITPFQTYIWLDNWQRIVGLPIYKIKPTLVAIYKHDLIEAIFPLGIRKAGPINILEWLGGPNSDYMVPIVKKNSEIFNSEFFPIWDQIKSSLNFDILKLSMQPSHIGEKKNPFFHFLDSKFMMNSYQSQLSDDWQEFKLVNISKKVLADSRRQRRRLSQIGELEFKIYDDEVGISQVIDTMIVQKKRRYKEKEGWDMFQVPEFQQFYKHLPKNLNVDNSIHCSALLLDKKLIACHWGLLNKDTLFYIMPTHEGGEFAKYSAGKLLLEELLEWCSLNGIQYFDFTGGEEPYKKIWTNRSFELSEAVESKSLIGYIYLYFGQMKNFFRDLPIIGRLLRGVYNLIRNK